MIQFLSFLRTLGYSKQFLDDQPFYVVEFAGMDFLSFTGVNCKNTYQRSKALEFLTSLQEIKSVVQKFSDNEFRRSLMLPYLKLKKQNRRWTIRMAIGEELYFYQYPFIFQDSFVRWEDKYDLSVKLKLIESISTIDLEKRFPVKSFLNQFSIANKKRSRIKSKVINLFFELRDYGLIEDELELTFNSTNIKDKRVLTKKVKDLNSKLITKLNYISFHEKLK